jgi:hypothetical protein
MRLRYFVPLAGHVVPTLAIGYGLGIPGSWIEGLNALTLGFAASVRGTCVAYGLGLRQVLRDHEELTHERL